MFSESDQLISHAYIHDFRNPYSILKANLDMKSTEGMESLIGLEELTEDQMEEFEDFMGVAWAAIERLESTDDLRFVEEDIETISRYKHDLPAETGEIVDRIIELNKPVNEYLSRRRAGWKEEVGIRLETVLAPLGNFCTGNPGRKLGTEDTVYGDHSLCLVANTIGLNWQHHGQREDGLSQLWTEVEEYEDFYEIGIWDNGPGLDYDKDPEEIFEDGNGENTGFGLYAARELTELFDGLLEYSEEYASREDGFGLEWTLMKPDQYSTSESL